MTFNTDELELLAEEFNASEIEQREAFRDSKTGEQKYFKYATATTIIKRLNKVAGWYWGFKILNSETIYDVGKSHTNIIKEIYEYDEEGKLTSKEVKTTNFENKKPRFIIVTGQLFVIDSEGKEWPGREQAGASDVKYKFNEPDIMLDFGNDKKAAISDCIKKCATLYGVALDLYEDKKSSKDQIDKIVSALEKQGKKKEDINVNKLYELNFAEAEALISKLK